MNLLRPLLLAIVSCFVHLTVFAQASNELLEKADFLLQNNRFDEAIVMLDQASKLDPSNSNINLKKANALIARLRYKEAVQALEEGVKNDPENSELYALLGNLYFQFRNAQRAVYNYDMAFKTDPSIERKLEYKLNILDILDKLNKNLYAYKHIQDAKLIMGDNFDLRFKEAEYYNARGEYQEAAKLMRELIKEVPAKAGNGMYFWQLGYALHQLGEYEASKEALINANEGEYKSKMYLFTPQYYYNLANAYFKIHDYKQAEHFLTKSLSLDPAFSQGFELQKRLAAVLADKSNIIKAQESAINAEKNATLKLDKQKELARLYFQNGEYQQAMMTIDQVLEVDPRDVTMIFLQALSENKLDQREEAHDLLGKIARNPKLPGDVRANLSFALATIYKNEEEFKRAEESLKDAYYGEFKDAVKYEFEQINMLKQLKELANMEEGTISDEEVSDDGSDEGR